MNGWTCGRCSTFIPPSFHTFTHQRSKRSWYYARYPIYRSGCVVSHLHHGVAGARCGGRVRGGPSPQPLQGLLRGVYVVPPLHAGRRPDASRLEALRPDGSLLHQGVRGRDKYLAARPARRQWIDGICVQRTDEARLCLVSGGLARVPRHPPAGRGGHHLFRRKDRRAHSAAQHAGPSSRDPSVLGDDRARGAHRGRQTAARVGGKASKARVRRVDFRLARRS